MKRILIVLCIGGALMSCNNGANDGDPRTDTTTLPVDTNVGMDTSNHINSNNGTIYLDSSRRDSAR